MIIAFFISLAAFVSVLSIVLSGGILLFAKVQAPPEREQPAIVERYEQETAYVCNDCNGSGDCPECGGDYGCYACGYSRDCHTCNGTGEITYD